MCHRRFWRTYIWPLLDATDTNIRNVFITATNAHICFILLLYRSTMMLQATLKVMWPCLHLTSFKHCQEKSKKRRRFGRKIQINAIFSINISFFLYPALLVRHAVYLCILPNRLRGFQKEQKHFLYAGKIRRIAKKKQYKIGKTLSHDFRASVQLLSIIKLLIFFRLSCVFLKGNVVMWWTATSDKWW